MNIRKLIGTIAAGGLVALAAYAVAETLGPIDFEALTYTVGNISGQDGWMKTGVYDAAVVAQALYPAFGSQSLRISNATTSGSFGDHTFSKPLANEAGESTADNGGMSWGTRQPYFEAQWDFASMVPGSEQPGLSVVASPDRGDGARMSWVQMRDTSTGLEVNFYDENGVNGTAPCFQCANFVFHPVASGLNRTVPHTIKITMQFVDGPSNDIVKVYVDGTLMFTGGSWEDYYTMDTESSPTPPMVSRTVDSVLFRVGGTAAPATLGNGFLIDNLTLKSGPVPPVLIGPPTNKEQCKKGGWATFNNPSFKNQGDCVSWVASAGKNDPGQNVPNYTLYADGSINCPGADDLSDPDGHVKLTPTTGGVNFEIHLISAEPNATYTVAISEEPTCASPTFYAAAFTTNAAGNANYSGLYATTPGAHNLLVNMVTAATTDPDREIGTTDANIFVP